MGKGESGRFLIEINTVENSPQSEKSEALPKIKDKGVELYGRRA
jgi:hypothetical protein